MNRRILAVVAAAVLGTMAGCTSGDMPPPPRETSSRTRPQPTSPPPITRPLDASAYRDRVCDLLTDEQAAKHSVEKADQTFDETDNVHCYMRKDRTEISVSYYYATDLLGAIYRRELLLWKNATLIPLDVVSQPAVWAEPPRNALYHCKLAVGLSGTQGIEITLSLARGRDDACDRAIAVAEDIVRNLGG